MSLRSLGVVVKGAGDMVAISPSGKSEGTKLKLGSVDQLLSTGGISGPGWLLPPCGRLPGRNALGWISADGVSAFDGQEGTTSSGVHAAGSSDSALLQLKLPQAA